MIIANPIYDVVFKRLMENERVAKFFISTLLSETIESVTLRPQELTYVDELVGVRLFRLDFVAVIKTKEGAIKKVLIEIQKAKNRIDLMRFRNYLAEQYKKEDTVNNKKTVLPITTIYLLGFKIPEIKTACVHVERQYKDLINETTLTLRSDFIENLTHDSYVVQIERITDRYKSKLDKLLSIFQQANFVDDYQLIKEFKHSPDEEGIKLMTDILHHSGTDPKTRKQIEAEREAWRTIDAFFDDERQSYQQRLEAKEKRLNEKNQIIDEQQKAMEEQRKAMEEQRKLIEDLQRKLNQK